jgi:hypothetical protein
MSLRLSRSARRLDVYRPGSVAVVIALGATVLLPACGSDGGSKSTNGTASSAASLPSAPLRTCRERGGAGRITPDPRRDRIIGPVALYRFYENYDASRNTPPVRGRNASISFLALVEAGSKVTLVVPKSQRSFMKLEFWRAGERYSVALQACRRVPRSKWRRECGSPPYTACDWINTPFDGGLDIHFLIAKGKECSARLEVWVDGEEKPLRELLLPHGGHGCPVRRLQGANVPG